MSVITRATFLFAFLPPFKGSKTVQLLSCEGFLKYDIILQLCFWNKPPWGLIRVGLICKNDFLGGDLFEGGLFGGGGLFEDLQ